VDTPELALATSNTWTTRAAMPAPSRSGFVASAVPNASGQWIVYVLGGSNADDEDGDTNLGALAYNVATNTWTNNGDATLRAAFMNGAARLDKTIYITGGESIFGSEFQYRNTTWAYETTTGKLLQKADMPRATTSGITGVIRNQVYVLPGYCSGDSQDPGHCTTFGPLRQLYRYNPATNSWTTRHQAPHTHVNGAAAVINNKLYVVGGSNGNRSLDVYDPVANSWQIRASIPTAGDQFWGAALLNQFYVVVLMPPNQGSKLYAYNPATNQWTSRKAPTNGVAGPPVKVMLNGTPRLFMPTGYGSSYLYTP
jgi:N-acetylneuraminic acid mutarotase